MFAPKNFNLSEELINASRKVMEQKTQVVEEETELNEEEEALFEAFEEFLEENFYVDQLTEEEVEYLLDMFINEADEEPKSGSIGSAFKSLGKLVGIGGGSSQPEQKATTPEKKLPVIDGPASTPKTPTELKREAPVGGLSGSPGSEDWVRGGQQGKPNAPGSAADAAQKRSAPTPQRTQQSRQQTPSMSARKPSSSGSSYRETSGQSAYDSPGKPGSGWKERAFNPGTGG